MKIIEKISKISWAMIFALALTSAAFVNANDAPLRSVSEGENESLYRHNALENTVSFAELQERAENDMTEDSGLPRYSEDYESKLRLMEDLHDLTEKQNFSTREIDRAMGNLKNRNEVKTFLIGNNLAVLKFQLVQIKEISILLDALLDKTEDETITSQINNQVKFLQEEQKKVEEFIFKQNNEFSLFGWFTNIL